MSSLTITNVQASNIGEYRCLATNSQGSVTSQLALLQAASKSVCVLLPSTFTYKLLVKNLAAFNVTLDHE